MRAWSQAPVRSVAYTHGHSDHACSFSLFLADGDRPEVIAQENCAKRFERYDSMCGFNQHINRRQFADPDREFPKDFLRPSLTFRDSFAHTVGGVDVEFHAAKGETDDHCYIWIPSRGALFVGDNATWKIPNAGNPLKLQRYPIEWADGLEQMAKLGAEWLCPGHDLVLRGAKNVRTLLRTQAQYLRSLIDQVRNRMNAGQSYDEILHGVQPDPELAKLPFLRSVYNHPQFIVRDLLRNWGGWWDGVGGSLLPAPRDEQANEIIKLAGGVKSVLDRALTLAEEGNHRLACHLIDWTVQAEPGSCRAQMARRDVYRGRAEVETAGMARGFFLTEVLEAEHAIAELAPGA